VKHWHPVAKQIYNTMHTRLEKLTEHQREVLLRRDGGKKLGYSWINDYDIDVFTR